MRESVPWPSRELRNIKRGGTSECGNVEQSEYTVRHQTLKSAAASALMLRTASTSATAYQLSASRHGRRKPKVCYYKTCPACGANLDPGEICDCQDPAEEKTADAPTPAA